MIAFATAIILMLITPGPGVLAAAGVGASYGLRAGSRYLAGLFAGNLAVSLIVISGLWTLLATLPNLRFALSIASLAYFIYLAAKVAMANSDISFGHVTNAPRFANGLVLQLINPKAYAVNTFLFSNFPLFPSEWALEVGVKLIIFNAIWIPIHFVWLQLGAMIQRLDLEPHVQRRINIMMAASLLVVVALAVLEIY